MSGRNRKLKIVENHSLGDLVLPNKQAQEVIDKVKDAGNIRELDSILDMLWAPDGMTREEWVEFFKRERDHILARFGK